MKNTKKEALVQTKFCFIQLQKTLKYKSNKKHYKQLFRNYPFK